MLLERSLELAQLRAWLDEADQGSGRLAFVSGEMGIGKTAIVTAFARQVAPFCHTMILPFDGISSPEPLGPIHDLGRQLGIGLDPARGAPEQRSSLFGAIESVLRRSSGTNVIVLEDAHWADNASLEFLRFLGRRLSELRALVIVTYRDDEESSTTTLRQVLGDLATAGVARRIVLQPLSLDAVGLLSQGSEMDPSTLYRFTGGNPFFVTEVLGAGSTTPISIRDSVLGRVARLSAPARETIDIASAIGQRFDSELLASVLDRSIVQDVTDAIRCGLLRFDGTVVEFRHAAVWAVIVEELNPLQTQHLHSRILKTLSALSTERESARLAHHAELANDLGSALEWSLKAARDAGSLGSHREAIQQYERALRCGQALKPEARAQLLEDYALACSFTSQIPNATRSQASALEIWRSLGDTLKYGRNLWRLSRYWYFDGHYRRAAALVEEAYRILEATPDTVEFVLAGGHLVEWRIRANQLEDVRELSEKISSIAERLGDEIAQVHADITAAMVSLAFDDLDGFAALDETRLRANAIGHQEFELRALFYLANTHGTHRHQAASRKWLDERLDRLHETDLTTMRSLFGTVRLESLLDRCEWTQTITEANAFLVVGESAGRVHLSALLTRARAQIRSGAGDLDFSEIANLVAKLDDPVAVGKFACLQLELAWLTASVTPTFPNALLAEVSSAGDATTTGELMLWLTRTRNLQVTGLNSIIEPYLSELAGNYLQAKRMWDEMDSPLLALRALSASNDESELRTAHEGMLRLGAVRDARRVARLLETRGVRGVPRGPRPSTLANAASLSNQEMVVLRVLAEGCTDREIAHRLSVSEKTVGTQVSSILRKLEVANRTQAVIRAQKIGLISS